MQDLRVERVNSRRREGEFLNTEGRRRMSGHIVTDLSGILSVLHSLSHAQTSLSSFSSHDRPHEHEHKVKRSHSRNAHLDEHHFRQSLVREEKRGGEGRGGIFVLGSGKGDAWTTMMMMMMTTTTTMTTMMMINERSFLTSHAG